MKDSPDAIAVFGQPNFNDRYTTGAGPQRLGAITATLLDQRNQRLFVSDARNNRVMVWDIRPDHLTKTPAAMMVLGQPDFASTKAGAGATGLKSPGDLYYDAATDRLFLSDSGNNRVLVFDARPSVLKTGAAASVVLGQTDFSGVAPAVGAAHMNNPGALLHDPSHQRLFVGDKRNNRILVFDVNPARLKSGAPAKYVFGQDTFETNAPRTNLKKASPELRYMKIDQKRQRLYATEAISLNRLMVFDVDPAHMRNNPDALSVIFQDSQDDIDVRVSRNQETWPRPDVMDFDRGILYSAASHPGGNRITMYDVSGDLPKAGLRAIDMLGHFDGDGNLDWTARAAAGRDGVLGRVFYPRSLALDPVDHRIFVGDQYNNRVLMYDLDRENRIANREASVILGQPDKYDVRIHPISDRTMKLPYGFAYDPGEKRLFIGDGWHNRVLVFDADPKRLTTYPRAIAVLGQPDFTSEMPNGTGANRIAMDMMHPGNSSIGGGGPPAIAMAVDTKTNRLFMSDSGNNRVLVFDVRPEHLKSSASAVNVLGQSNFTDNKPTVIPPNLPAGTDPEPYKRGFNSPGGIAYDMVRDRLFVIDAENSRVLVFKASPADLKNGMSAYAVIGQKDFITAERVALQPSRKPAGGISEAVGSRRFGLPSSLAYDPVRNWLYVTDRNNERTLVFDVDEKLLNTDQAAHMVLGKDDFVTDAVTIDEQESFVEPRELAIDAEHQRLFQTDTPMGKVLVFDLPLAKRDLSLPARGMSTYSTIDPWNGRNMPARDKRKEWSAKITSAKSELPGASIVLTNTRQFVDPRSERRSRMLISETTLIPTSPGTQTAFFVDQGEGDNILILTNGSAAAANARIALAVDGQRNPISLERSVPAGAQVRIAVGELGNAVAGKDGVLRVTSSVPVSASMVKKIHTSRNEDLYVAMPAVEAFQQKGLFSNADGAAIAGLKIGGGYSTELILVNTSATQASGRIELRNEITGEPAKLADVDSGIKWSLAPGAVFRTKLGSSSGLEKPVFAVVTSDGKQMPWSSAIVSQRDGDLLLGQTVIPGRARTSLAWFALDTMPDLVRHGMTGSTMEYSVANPSRWPALVRFTLFDADGNEKGRYEQIMAPGSQRRWSTADLFNVQQAKGSIRLWSDVPVALSAKRVTTSLRGERVENELGYLDASVPSASGALLLPTIWDGEGIASKIVLVNPRTTPIAGAIEFKPADSDTPAKIVLR
jgi:DNA-binding beta-propeller fold protein YncE